MSHNEFPEPLPRAVDRPMDDSGRAIQKVSAQTAGLGGGIPINRIMPSRQRRKIGRLAKHWSTGMPIKCDGSVSLKVISVSACLHLSFLGDRVASSR